MSASFFNLVASLQSSIDALDKILAGGETETVLVDGVNKNTISKAIKDKFSSLQAMIQGSLAYETKALMVAAGAPPAGELAKVWNDTSSNNGLYGYTGGAWVKSSHDPFTDFDARLNLSDGAAIQVESANQLILNRSIPQAARTYLAGTSIDRKRALSSTFCGWAAPFDWDGTPFNLIKLHYRMEFPGKTIRVRLWDANKVLLRNISIIGNEQGVSWVALGKLFTTDEAPVGILNVSFDSPDKATRLMPNKVSDFINVADAATINKQLYTTTGNAETLATWSPVSSGIGYPPPIELFDSTAFNAASYINLDTMQLDMDYLRGVFRIVENISSDAVVTANAPLESPTFLARSESDGFAGFGQVLSKQTGKSINAVKIPGIRTGTTDKAKMITKVHMEIRDGSQTGTLLAKGLTRVIPNALFGEITILLRNVATDALLTLTEAELPDNYWVGYWGTDDEDNSVATGEALESVLGFANISQYKNLLSGGWSTYSGNPSLGIETEYLPNLTVEQDYTYFGNIDLTESEISKDLYTLIIKESSLAFDSAASQNVVSNQGYNNRAAPFSGWGDDLIPVDGDFNVVRLPFISRKSTLVADEKWVKIIVEVRDGRCNSTNIIARGETSVDPETNVLQAVSILLKDPITGENKTLTKEDFPSNITGITYRAVNEFGSAAACGESKGIPNNFEGSSYYTTNNGTSWAGYSNNVPLGIEQLLAINPVESTLLRVRDEVKLPTEDSGKAIGLYGSDVLYALENHQINLYFDSLLYGDADRYSWDVACGTGEQLAECYRLSATNSADQALTLQLRDNENYDNLWGEKDIAIRVAGSDNGNGVTRKCLFIGDSTTAGGQYVGEVANLASNDSMNIANVGTKGSGLALHEGRGGWRVDDYTTIGRQFYRFNVTGVTAEPAMASTIYSHNGSEYKVHEIHLTGGNGYLICERSSGTVDAIPSGTLTKVSGAGDGSISFGSWSLASGNPFWNDQTGLVDFSAYMSENAFTLGADDWVFFHLGINDIFGQTSDSGVVSIASKNMANLNDLILNIRSYNAGIRIGMLVAIPPARYQDAFGYNYDCGQTRARYKRNILLYNQIMTDYFKGQEANKIYLCPLQYVVDPINGFPSSQVDVNSRSTVQVTRLNNSVHPNTSGYNQMADEIWAFLKYWA